MATAGRERRRASGRDRCPAESPTSAGRPAPSQPWSRSADPGRSAPVVSGPVAAAVTGLVVGLLMVGLSLGLAPAVRARPRYVVVRSARVRRTARDPGPARGRGPAPAAGARRRRRGQHRPPRRRGDRGRDPAVPGRGTLRVVDRAGAARGVDRRRSRSPTGSAPRSSRPPRGTYTADPPGRAGTGHLPWPSRSGQARHARAAATSSAIWIVLRAAPLRRLSPLMNMASPRSPGTPGSWRSRPT